MNLVQLERTFLGRRLFLYQDHERFPQSRLNLETKREAQQLFEKEKNSEAQQLAKSVKENRERAIENLQQKMEAFDNDVEIDALVEHLVGMAKDRICH